MILLQLEIPGVPQPKGSMRRFKNAITADNPRTKEWQHRIAYFCKSALSRHVPVMGAYRLSGVFSFERPEAHMQVKPDLVTLERPLRKGYGVDHTQKPDLDKLIRTVFDALKNIVYVDDCQVVGVSFTKVWTQTKGSGVWLQVEALS